MNPQTKKIGDKSRSKRPTEAFVLRNAQRIPAKNGSKRTANSILAIPNKIIKKLIKPTVASWALKVNPRTSRMSEAPKAFSIPEIIHPKVVQLANTIPSGEIAINQ
jgi:hypothetical protein